MPRPNKYRPGAMTAHTIRRALKPPCTLNLALKRALAKKD
jgi:hypothetical protein